MDKLKRKITICYLANIPFTYLSVVLFGWLLYLVIGGNPTFIIPYNILLIIFYALYITMLIIILRKIKLYSIQTYLLMFLESAIIYLIIWGLTK